MRVLAMIVSAAALLLTTPALAQDAAADPRAADSAEARAMVEQLTTQLQALGEQIGVDVPELGPIFAPLFEAALPNLPDQEDYGFSIGFNFETNVTDGEALERDEDWTPVFRDAQACAALEPGAAVVHFERLDVAGGAGHHCVLAGPGRDDPGVWVLMGVYVVETPQRRLESRVGAAAVTGSDVAEGTYAEAAAIGDPQIPALIALSTRMGETATGLLMATPLSRRTD